MSSDESDLIDYESNGLGSDSGSSGTHYFNDFYLRFYESVGSVSVLGSDVFAPTVVEHKGGQLLAFFWQ